MRDSLQVLLLRSRGELCVPLRVDTALLGRRRCNAVFLRQGELLLQPVTAETVDSMVGWRVRVSTRELGKFHTSSKPQICTFFCKYSFQIMIKDDNSIAHKQMKHQDSNIYSAKERNTANL